MRRLFLAGALLLAMLIPASSASAALEGEYAKFKTCPVSNPAVGSCVYAESTSGSFTIGAKTVPLIKPVILKGGLSATFQELTSQNIVLYAPTDGQTLSKTPQTVPGGLTGVVAPSWWPQFLRDLFNETINNGFTGVTATVELAAPASAVKFNFANLFARSGPGLALPVKVKLDNPFLGSSCYIGSNSQPIQLNLTDGTTSPPPPNTPITGDFGQINGADEGNIVFFENQKILDNSFSAPGTNGCGGLFSFLVDPFVSSILGVPAAAGHNTAILQGFNYLASGAAVRAKS
jgi:hypothetical protein